MITAIVSAIKGPILSVLSGCLGESGMLRLWLWNLVPTQANMPGIVTFPGNYWATYGMLDLSFFVVWENPAEHWLGDEIQTCNLWRIWKTGPHYQAWIQGPIWVWATRCRALASLSGLNPRPNLGLGTSALYTVYYWKLKTL